MASALDDLKAGGVFTGGVFGALAMLRAIVASPLVQPGHIVAFFDKGVPPARLKLLPGYKQKRKERKEMLDEADREKAMTQIGECYRMWPLLGVTCLAYKDREADDGVAAAARVFIERGYKPLIATSDRDLWQAINWGAEIWDLSKHEILGERDFETTTHVHPTLWQLYKVLIGDSSDEIKGVNGCGPKRAQQLLHVFDADGETDTLIQLRKLCAFVRYEVRNRTPRAWEKNLIEAEGRLRNVVKGTDLWSSFGGTKGLRKRLDEPGEVRVKPFLQLCNRLSFNTVLGDPDNTLKPFVDAAQRR